MRKYPITPNGHKRMEEELSKLRGRDRPRIIAAIAEAKEHGDLSENAEYHAAKEEQGMIEAKINDLENKLAMAEVIDPSTMSSEKIQFGALVELIDSETKDIKSYRIVGDYESDLKLDAVSIFSPIAQAMLGKMIDDEIEVQTPKGIKFYEVKSFKYSY